MSTISRMEVTPRMSGVVTSGDLIFLSGITADPKLADITAQTKDVLDTIERRLAMAGSDKEHILNANVWLSDIRYFEAMNEVWDGWVSRSNPPARATVEARLARPSALVEIAVVAVKAK